VIFLIPYKCHWWSWSSGGCG